MEVFFVRLSDFGIAGFPGDGVQSQGIAHPVADYSEQAGAREFQLSLSRHIMLLSPGHTSISWKWPSSRNSTFLVQKERLGGKKRWVETE
jgi:hypothetical protein